MTDERKKELMEMAEQDGVELNEDVLDSISGGYVYHDMGDAAAHRKDSYYVVDDKGQIVMRLDSLAAAKHWANNLRTSQELISADQFESLRKNGHL